MIDILVRGDTDRSLQFALKLFKERCARTKLAKDLDRHRIFEKPSTQRRKKHWKALMRQLDINKKMERKRQYL